MKVEGSGRTRSPGALCLAALRRWWASGIAVGIAWFALATIIGIPLGIWIINRLPSILTLRPRTRTWVIGQDAEGRRVVSAAGRPQVAWYVRGVWFVLVGWWASALWMGLAWFVQLTVVGIPIALPMFNRTPFVASLYRYQPALRIGLT